MFRSSKYRDFDTVKQEVETECSTLILMTTREDFDASVQAFDLKKTGMGPKKNKISMANADGQIRTDTISNFLKGYNRNLTGQQKEEVRQQLISTNRKVFEREHASVESLVSMFAFDIKLVDLTTMHECGASDGYFDTEQGESESNLSSSL